jgi:hypothetical protein
MPFYSTLKPLNANLWSTVFVAICFLTIGTVSAFDTWSTAANSQILRMEQNPICEALLMLDPESCLFFVIGKSAGTITALFTLGLLLKKGYRHAMLITGSVALFQFGLLVYLCLSDPLMNNMPNFSLLFSETPESIFAIR